MLFPVGFPFSPPVGWWGDGGEGGKGKKIPEFPSLSFCLLSNQTSLACNMPTTKTKILKKKKRGERGEEEKVQSRTWTKKKARRDSETKQDQQTLGRTHTHTPFGKAFPCVET